MSVGGAVVASKGSRLPAWEHGVLSVGFIALHIGGVLHTLRALQLADFFSFRSGESGVSPGLSLVLVATPYVALLLLAGMEGIRTLGRLWEGEPEPSVGVRARAAMYVALVAVLVRGFAPFAYPAYAVWSALLPRLQRAFAARHRRRAEAAVICVAVSTVALDLLVLRTGEAAEGGRDDVPSHLGFPVNAGGHYDTEFLPASSAPDKSVVVDIGDSFSYGDVPHPLHFTTIAERLTADRDVQIYNMGRGELGPADYLELLEREAIPLEPALVIVNLFIGDDIMAGRPAETGASHEYDDHGDPQVRSTGVDLRTAYPWLADASLEEPTFTPGVFLAVETRRARAVCSAPMEAFQPLFETLAAMQLRADAAGVPLAFVLIPDEFQVEDGLWDAIVKQRDALAKAPVELERDRPQRLVREWMRGRGMPVLDLLPVLRAVPPMNDGGRHLYHLRDTHFNARGNEEAGRALAGFVESLLARASPAKHAQADATLPWRIDVGDASARRWLDFGWNADEGRGGGSFVWSEGKLSALRVPLPAVGDIRMDFEVLPFAPRITSRQRISIVVNGSVIGELPVRRGLRTYSVSIPAASLREGDDVIEFRYRYTRSPRDLTVSPDTRRLAVAWYSIHFEKRAP